MKQSTLLISLLLFTLLFLVACGGDSSSGTSGGNDSSSQAIPVPTAMSGTFKAVGESTIITGTSSLTTTTATTDAVAAPSADLSLGQRAYEKNKCADCHGAQGEGVADKGKAIGGTALSLQDFDKVLRTGGGLGNTHIFGRSAVSPNGMNALYAFVQSLK